MLLRAAVALVSLSIVVGCHTRAEETDANTPQALVPVESHVPASSSQSLPAAQATPAPAAAVQPAPAPAGDAVSASGHHANPPVTAPATDPEIAAPAVREITIPAGTALRVRLSNTVSSASSSVEDAVQGTVRTPVVVRGVTVIPAGSIVRGYVSEADRSGRVKGRARIGVRFTSVTVGNSRYNIRTAAISRQARGTKKADAAKIGVGAGAGAVVGAIAGGKKGAAIGAGVGAAGGTGVVLATRGAEVSIGPAAQLTTTFADPVSIRVR